MSVHLYFALAYLDLVLEVISQLCSNLYLCAKLNKLIFSFSFTLKMENSLQQSKILNVVK